MNTTAIENPNPNDAIRFDELPVDIVFYSEGYRLKKVSDTEFAPVTGGPPAYFPPEEKVRLTDENANRP